MDPSERWQRTWSSLGARVDGQLLQQLIERYGETHRKYHSLRHLEECFAKLDELRALAEHPAEIELALWFHDAIYDPARHDNEKRSADWARSSAVAAGAAAEVAERLCGLVMATRHDAEPHGTDQQVMVDVDLAILGAQPDRFDEYETQIREEYAWVPRLVYRRKRKQILLGFLSRPTIYATKLFIERYEQQARANLARSLRRL